MNTEQLEQRVILLEHEVARIKQRVAVDDQSWWERITGTFADDEDFDRAMQLGRDYRESLRVTDSESDAD